MELWIRSQDKMTLSSVYNLYVIERDFAKNDSIWWEIFCNDEISLGLYLKERALEVLDEIQSIIIGKYVCDKNLEAALSEIENKENIEKLLKQMAVYEMPEE